MLDQLVVVHQKLSDVSEENSLSNLNLPPAQWVIWQTCLRYLAVGFSDISKECVSKNNLNIFYGEEAYRFFLEVVCGLHSPVVGETEVMGQFKDLIESTQIQLTVEKSYISKCFQALLTDSKIIREKFLKDTGSKSYGSLVRRHLKNAQGATILGAGKLAKEILPWLKNVKNVQILSRRIEQGQKLSELFPYAKAYDLNNSPNIVGTFVIAAPLSNDEVLRIVKLKGDKIKTVVDLRDSSKNNPLELDQTLVTLHDLFAEIKQIKDESLVKVEGARTLIVELSTKRFKLNEIRPFGWEDLCG